MVDQWFSPTAARDLSRRRQGRRAGNDGPRPRRRPPHQRGLPDAHRSLHQRARAAPEHQGRTATAPRTAGAGAGLREQSYAAGAPRPRLNHTSTVLANTHQSARTQVRASVEPWFDKLDRRLKLAVGIAVAVTVVGVAPTAVQARARRCALPSPHRLRAATSQRLPPSKRTHRPTWAARAPSARRSRSRCAGRSWRASCTRCAERSRLWRRGDARRGRRLRRRQPRRQRRARVWGAAAPPKRREGL